MTLTQPSWVKLKDNQVHLLFQSITLYSERVEEYYPLKNLCDKGVIASYTSIFSKRSLLWWHQYFSCQNQNGYSHSFPISCLQFTYSFIQTLQILISVLYLMFSCEETCTFYLFITCIWVEDIKQPPNQLSCLWYVSCIVWFLFLAIEQQILLLEYSGLFAPTMILQYKDCVVFFCINDAGMFPSTAMQGAMGWLCWKMCYIKINWIVLNWTKNLDDVMFFSAWPSHFPSGVALTGHVSCLFVLPFVPALLWSTPPASLCSLVVSDFKCLPAPLLSLMLCFSLSPALACLVLLPRYLICLPVLCL